jgi:hypothetical protein
MKTRILKPGVVLNRINLMENIPCEFIILEFVKSMVEITGEMKLRQKWMAIDVINRNNGIIKWN